MFFSLRSSVALACVSWAILAFGCTKKSPPPAPVENTDYRKISLQMDSRIAVDGKRICFRYAPRGTSDRCAALRSCQEIAEREIGKALKGLKPEQKAERLGLMLDRASVWAYRENSLLKGLELFQEAQRFAATFDPEAALDVEARVGVVQLRLGELKNCLNHHNSESCIFPLSRKAEHVDKSGSRRALAVFYEYLKKRPDDDHVKWLVNILHQTLGTYPAGVPKEYLIPLDRLQPEEKFPRFPNVAPAVGINHRESFGGVVAEDFDGDGYLELIFGSLDPCDGLKYYRLDPAAGKYVDASVSSGLAVHRGGGLVIPIDYDQDGKMDLYVTRGAWHPGGREYPVWGGFSYNTLLRNEGGGKFRDVTEETGLRGEPNSNLSSNWGDFNNDGLPDLFVCNESRDPDLFLNRGARFENVIEKSGIVNRAICKGSVAGDLDGDGNLDLVLHNYGAPKFLFFGKGDGTFRPSPFQPRLEEPKYGFPVTLLDFDNDGHLDLFLASFPPDIDNFAKWLQGKPNRGELPKLFRNEGNGSLKDVTAEVGLDKMALAMSLNTGDVDSDGFPDLMLGTGANSLGDLEPNRFFHNVDGKRFREVTMASGLGSLQKGHGIVFADLNQDGFEDVIVQLGGSSLADKFFPAIHMNPGFPGHHWVGFRLRSQKGDRFGYRARIEVVAADAAGKKRSIYKWVGNSGSFGSNPISITLVGLGRADRIQEVNIRWPDGVTRKVESALVPGAVYEIAAEGGAARRVPYAPVKFRGNDQASPHRHH